MSSRAIADRPKLNKRSRARTQKKSGALRRKAAGRGRAGSRHTFQRRGGGALLKGDDIRADCWASGARRACARRRNAARCGARASSEQAESCTRVDNRQAFGQRRGGAEQRPGGGAEQSLGGSARRLPAVREANQRACARGWYAHLRTSGQQNACGLPCDRASSGRAWSCTQSLAVTHCCPLQMYRCTLA